MESQIKTKKQLQEYYDQVLLEDLNILESNRKKIVQKLLLAFASLFVLILLLAGVMLGTGSPVLMIPISIFVSIFSGYAIYTYLIRDYVRDYKGKIIGKIVSFIDNNLKYQPTGYVDENVYMQSELFPRRTDRYNGDDLVEGKLGETNVKFSELHTQYKTTSTNSKGHTQTHWHTIFKGLFFMADFNKSFKTKTVVLPDMAESLFGNVGTKLQSWNKSHGELVKLEDPEFEELFVVYGEDQVEARYILSTSLMKRIVDFKKKTNKEIHLSFVGSKVFVAISYKKDLFEPKIFTSLLDFQQINEYYNDLRLAIDIVEDLNLNTRIWG